MDDRKTIQECKIPNYGIPVIPVNVSMLPKGQSYSNSPIKTETSSKPKAASGTTSNNQTSNSNQNNSSSSSCCIIL